MFPFFKFCILFTLISLSVNTKINAQQLTNTKEALSFMVYKTTDATLTIQDVKNNSDNFKTPDSFKEKTKGNEIYWIRLDFKNLSPSNDTHLFLKHNNFDYGQLYVSDNSVSNIGLLNKNSRSNKIAHNYYYSEVKIPLKPALNKGFLYLKIKRLTFNESISNWSFSVSSASYDNKFSENDLQSIIPYYIFAGICILAWFWSISFFFMLKKIEFFYYSTYVLILFIYSCGDKLGIYQFIFDNNYSLQYWCSQSVVFLANLAYAFYIIKYLHTKSNYPVFHKILKGVIVFNILTLIALLIFHLTDNYNGYIYVNNYLIYIYYIATLPLLAYLVYIAKSALAYFVAFATLSLCLSALARMIFAQTDDGLYLDSFYFIIIGCSIEIIIFAFGLNYKARRELLENFMLKEKAYISKTKELRAQINPHFIFNSLSSIQYLITNNNKASALKYLSKFSRLTRNVLESSIEPEILLVEEIKMLNDYLELESLRFKNTFKYTITVSPDVNPNSIEIPILIIQPFVENAILHGLLNKKNAEKILAIHFKKESEFLICEIDDNGIGRDAAEKTTRIFKKKSRGLQVTKERLEMFNKLNDNTNNISIIDKTDKEGRSLGTKVIIKIIIKQP